MIIEHLGQTIDSISFDGNLDIADIEYIKQNYYKEDKEKALEQLRKVLLQGHTNISSIYAYYFERVAADTLLYTEKWSINEVLQCDPIIQIFLNKIKRNNKVFTSNDLVGNFKTAIRLGGKGICKKPSNFPLKKCKNILQTLSEKTRGGYGLS